MLKNRIIQRLLYTLYIIISCHYSVHAIEFSDHKYQIRTANDLKEFAELVNNGDSLANAILASDIDYRGYSGSIGKEDCPYRGEFDGACHKITIGFHSDSSHQALFRTVGRNGVVKNLFVDGDVFSKGQYAGGVVGLLVGGEVENCLVKVALTYEGNGNCYFGGVVGQSANFSIVKNCVFWGQIIVHEGTCASGIIGKISTPGTSIHNCMSLCDFELNDVSGSNSIAYLDHPNWLSMDDTYYLSNISPTIEGAQQITQEQWESGDVLFRILCRKLYVDEMEHLRKDSMFQNVLAYVGLGLLSFIMIAVILIICLFYYQEQHHIYKLLYEGAIRNHEQWVMEQQKVLQMEVPESQDDTDEVKDDTNENEMKEDEQSSNLQQLYIRLLSIMAKEKLYTNPDLDEPTIARIMCSNKSYISECISKCSKQTNFSSWIALYRINHAIQCLDENPNIAVKSLYIEAGFKNHTSFTRHFKNIVGMTATQYIKMRE